MTKQYEKRDAEFERWAEGFFNCPVQNLSGDREFGIAEAAFHAGWASRKKAVDYAIKEERGGWHCEKSGTL